MKKNVEKIRDDLYIKKGKFGYSIVYPAKDENGKVNWKNIQRALFSDLLSSLPYLLAVAALLLMLLPGARELKSQCEQAVNDCQENACLICNSNQVKNYNVPNLNISIGNDSVGELNGEKI